MNTSPAIRVSEILRQAKSIDDSAAAQAVFARLFGFEKLESHEFQDALNHAVADFREEVWQVDHLLRERNVPNDLRGPPIEALMNFTASLQLGSAYRTHRDNFLRPDIMVAWGWIAFILPPQDDEVTQEDLQRLETELGELERAAGKEGIPPALRAFILRQAKRIRAALARYRVRGVGPLREAMTIALGELVQEAPTFSTAASTPESKTAMAALGKVWSSAAKVAGQAKALYDVCKIVASSAPQIANAVGEAMQLLPGAGPFTS